MDPQTDKDNARMDALGGSGTHPVPETGRIARPALGVHGEACVIDAVDDMVALDGAQATAVAVAPAPAPAAAAAAAAVDGRSAASVAHAPRPWRPAPAAWPSAATIGLPLAEHLHFTVLRHDAPHATAQREADPSAHARHLMAVGNHANKGCMVIGPEEEIVLSFVNMCAVPLFLRVVQFGGWAKLRRWQAGARVAPDRHRLVALPCEADVLYSVRALAVGDPQDNIDGFLCGDSTHHDKATGCGDGTGRERTDACMRDVTRRDEETYSAQQAVIVIASTTVPKLHGPMAVSQPQPSTTSTSLLASAIAKHRGTKYFHQRRVIVLPFRLAIPPATTRDRMHD